MKRILITGVTGFLGTNLVDYLSSTGNFILFGYSREPEKAKKLFKDYPISILSDLSLAVMDEHKIDSLIHLAGIAHDLSNRYQPEDYYRVNFEGTKWLYAAFLNSNASQFIFLSSVKAVADISPTPLEESVEPNPVTDYGKSKWKAEQYLMAQSLPDGKQYYILRPCMIHGPGNKGNLNLLYRFVKMGIPYPLGKFTNKRSLLSVDNFTFVVQKIIEGNVPSGIYHLADEDYLSTTELYEVIANALGKKHKVWNIPTSLIQFGAAMVNKREMLNKLTESYLVSNSKMGKAVGRWPMSLRDGLTKTIASFNE